MDKIPTTTTPPPPPGKSGGCQCGLLPSSRPLPQLFLPSQHFLASYIVIPGWASPGSLAPSLPHHLYTKTLVSPSRPRPLISRHTNNPGTEALAASHCLGLPLCWHGRLWVSREAAVQHQARVTPQPVWLPVETRHEVRDTGACTWLRAGLERHCLSGYPAPPPCQQLQASGPRQGPLALAIGRGLHHRPIWTPRTVLTDSPVALEGTERESEAKPVQAGSCPPSDSSQQLCA